LAYDAELSKFGGLMTPENLSKLIDGLNKSTAMAVAVLALLVALSVIWKR
jgi:hypothetical protein